MQNNAGHPSTVQQVNVEYVPQEDRIRIRVSLNTGEICCWMTRRCLSLFWPLLLERFARSSTAVLQVDSQSKEMVLAFEHEKSVKASDLTTPYKHQDGVRALQDGSTVSPHFMNQDLESDFVIEQIRLPDGFTHDTWIVTLLPGVGSGVTLNMPLDFWHAFAHMLTQASDCAGWKLDLRLLPKERQATTSEVLSNDRMLH